MQTGQDVALAFQVPPPKDFAFRTARSTCVGLVIKSHKQWIGRKRIMFDNESGMDVNQYTADCEAEA
jgi:hypothetical protein